MGARAVAAIGLIVLGALMVGVLRLTSGRGPSFKITGNGLNQAASIRETGSSRPGSSETGTPPTRATSPPPTESTPDELRVLRRDAAWLKRQNTALRAKVKRLEQENDELRDRNKQLRRSLRKAWTSADSPSYGFIRTPAIETSVQDIDRKERTVVLAAGRKKKAASGMRFHLSRNGTYVGEVRVTEVLAGQSTAVWVMIKPGMRVEIGDTAATRL